MADVNRVLAGMAAERAWDRLPKRERILIIRALQSGKIRSCGKAFHMLMSRYRNNLRYITEVSPAHKYGQS